MSALSARSYHRVSQASSWEEIWEAGPYYHRLSELLEDAKHHAVIAGWQLDSRLPMPRPTRPGAPKNPHSHETLRQKVLRLCESKPDFQFYFLMWDHSYVYLPERELWQGRVWDGLHPRVHLIFDNRHPLGGAHHEKICVIDGKTALCGGIDLCGDRWDSPGHLFSDPRRSLNRKKENHGPYHDVAIQVGGEVCTELLDHLRHRWQALSSVSFPETAKNGLKPQGGHRVYMSRTQACIGPRGSPLPIVREIEFLLRDLISSAQKRILLEGQYFWSRPIMNLLIDKMHAHARSPGRAQPLEVVLIFADLAKTKSFTRKMAPYEMTLIQELQIAADQTGTRLIAGVPYAHPSADLATEPPKPVYIHSKLVIIDDRFLCIGSANFATRAMRIDTEVNLTFEARNSREEAHIRRVAGQVLAHWDLQDQKSEQSSLKPAQSVPPPLTRIGFRLYPKFFDPELPWGYILRRKIKKTSRRKPVLFYAFILLVMTVPPIALVSLCGVPPGWGLVYAILLMSAAWAPVPFTAVAILCALSMPRELGIRIALCALCVTAVVGYLSGRIFPEVPRRLGDHPALHERLGRRNFESLLKLLVDPRFSFRLKTHAQGDYCIPLPWFFFGTVLMLSAALSVVCRLLLAGLPKAWLDLLRADPSIALGFVLAWGCMHPLAKVNRPPNRREKPSAP